MTASLVSPVLVGRDAELTALTAALQRALAGDQAVVLVGGEAGVGKSRLVQEIAGPARAAGARVLTGSCIELGGGGIPLAPLVEVLRTLAGELEPDTLDPILGPARGELARLLPELDPGPTASAPGDGADAARVLELIVGVVARLAAARPLVLVFEDLQWADRSTLDLTALLVGGVGIPGVLFVCTVRSDELHRAHPFRRLAGRWEQQRSAERLELDRLGAEEVAALIKAIVDEHPDGELVDVVFERSEGIPLFVEELLGAARDGGVEQDYLPPSLRDVLLARADLLSPGAQHVLRVASAAGRWAPDELLVAVAGLPDAELYAGLREAVEHQLLIIDPTGRGYAFRHALARAAIHDDLLPGERARLHKAYAEALEARAELAGPGLGAAPMLAHHWLAAHDLPRALPASVRAGQAAAEASAPAEAQRHFELALELWTEVPDAEERAGIDHPDLLDVAAQAAYQAGAGDRALALVDEALAEVGDKGAAERRALLLERRAAVLRDLSREDEGIADLREAVALLPAEPPTRASARVLAALARSMLRADDLQQCWIFAERAVEAARAVGAVIDELDAEISLGFAMVHAGRIDEGLALTDARRDAMRRFATPLIALRADIITSDLLVHLTRWDDAVAVAEQGMARAEETGLARTLGAFLRGNKVEALVRSGRWHEAMALAAPAAEAGGVFAGSLLLLRAELHALCGRPAEAAADLRAARRQLGDTTASQYALPLAGVEAELARGAGDLEAARDVFERALLEIGSGDIERYAWPAVWMAMRIEAERRLAARDARRPTPEDAEQRADALRARADAMPTRTPWDHGHLALVAAEQARLQRIGELPAWAGAVDACRAMRDAHVLAYALLRHAETLSSAGDRQAAVARLRESLDLAERMGAAPLVEEARSLGRRARLDVEPAPEREAATVATEEDDELERLGLTAREREVLLLVADGRSNGQIADELVISRKTASVHVSNILAKLGVATRVEAAALAHRRGLARRVPGA
ncbi:MAG: hypothetical protein QOG11_1532 [Solirubrobacteraceae bacterium]|nr:hypothetical protein [Solirubrobacteraceae bacterium]